MARHGFSRRNMLRGGALLGGGVALGGGITALAQPSLWAERPKLTHGVFSGDVSNGKAVIWTRADRGAKMWVELSKNEDFSDSWKVKGTDMVSDNDYCGKAIVDSLPEGSTVHYRVWADGDGESEPLTGSLRTTPAKGQDVRFTWSADIAGQGFGINPDIGGYKIFSEIAELDPDFFLCSGDFYYGDNPLEEKLELPDGRIWKNKVSEAKSKVAETLDEFRGQYKYNLTDEHLLKLGAKVPFINQWDDHEVLNNWYPGEILDDDQYTEKSVDVLASRARKAFAEYTPSSLKSNGKGRLHRKISHGPLLDVFMLDMRTYKDENSKNDSPDGGQILGAEQLQWLKQELAASTATWKVIANDLPLGLIIGDGETAVEGVAQRDKGEPLGREVEIAKVLSHIKTADVRNVVWVTADVHYTAAHHYDPERASFTDFNPFWEFVAGPLNAGSFGPSKLDPTFGPEAVFTKAPDDDHQGVGPMDGYQFYGDVAIDAESKAMTVRLLEIGGTELFSQEITPE